MTRVNLAKVVTNAVASAWGVPLGQTPDYLDPQSQEALHEVDVSATARLFSFGQRQKGVPSGASQEGAGSDRWVTKQGPSHDTD